MCNICFKRSVISLIWVFSPPMKITIPPDLRRWFHEFCGQKYSAPGSQSSSNRFL